MSTLAPRYMHRFTCIGDACEDDCCGTWETLVDRASYERLARSMPEAQLHTLYELRADRTDDAWARTRRSGGQCPALDHGWCSIHRDHGAQALSDTCATYPRRLQRVNGRLEMSGHTSCPEVVRQLLSGDAVELEPFPATSLPRDTAEDALVSDDLRGYARALLGMTAPLPSRLWFVHELATRYDAGQPTDQVWAELSLPDTLLGLHADFVARKAPLGSAMAAVHAAVFGRAAPGRAIGPFMQLLAAARSTLPGESLPELLHAHLQRRAAFERHAELDRILGNYAADWWFARNHTDAASAVAHHHELVLRLASLRWLLLLQPAAAQLASTDDLHGLAVRVVYAFARAFDHSDAYLARQVAAGLDVVALARF